MTWQDYAACFGHGELFFPPARERPDAKVLREAAAFALCAICPVFDECEAASVGEEGIWAGRWREASKVDKPVVVG